VPAVARGVNNRPTSAGQGVRRRLTVGSRRRGEVHFVVCAGVNRRQRARGVCGVRCRRRALNVAGGVVYRNRVHRRRLHAAREVGIAFATLKVLVEPRYVEGGMGRWW